MVHPLPPDPGWGWGVRTPSLLRTKNLTFIQFNESLSPNQKRGGGPNTPPGSALEYATTMLRPVQNLMYKTLKGFDF